MSASASASSSASAVASSASSSSDSTNTTFKIVGICLAVGSGFFIGASFVVKKKGLLRATAKYGNETGQGHGYLKSWVWWTGMSMMVVGEILNFVAYAFTEAILVTPMGALSVVICAILSHFFLRESLTFFGWIGCTMCIIGATILALNAPEQPSVSTINEFKHLFVSVGFLVWAGILIASSVVLVFYAAPRWGKTHMLVYIMICSLIGGISVSCTQGLGASILTSIRGDNQVKNWFFWFLAGFVVITLLIEINYLNKALELFNTSAVTPTYFTIFTSATLITSFILYQGLKASVITLITMVLGFMVIVLGITLLQMSKVDPKHLEKLDRRSTMLFAAARYPTEETEKGEVTALEDPGMDALRGGFGAVGSIIRARSMSRRMSNASTMSGGQRYPYSNQQLNLSTHGMQGLQRYQLSDNPMPSDAMDQISLHAKSPTSTPGHGFPFPSPNRTKSHLKFEESDVVHQYGYTHHDGHTDATHESRPHSQPQLNAPHRPSRQFSATSYATMEDIREDEDEKESPAVVTRAVRMLPLVPQSAPAGQTVQPFPYPDPYRPSPSPTALPQSAGALSPPRLQSSKSQSRNLSGYFNFGSGPDLALGRKKSSESPSEIRGGTHRGTRDYPHLPKTERAKEHEERAALVHPDDEDDLGDRTFRDEDERDSIDLSSIAANVGRDAQ